LSNTARAAFKPAHRLTLVPVLAAVAVAAVMGAGCSKEKKAIAEIRGAYDAGEYREAVAFCRHAIRKGVDAAEIYYFYGASLVSLNRDFEGYRQFDEAILREPAMSPKIAQFLFASGEQSLRKRLRSQGGKRLQKAIEIDSATELGPYLYLVADEYYAAKDYEFAASLYRRAIEAWPDTSAAEPAYLNMAEAYAETGAGVRARESLEEMLELYPDGRLATQARWRLVNLLYEQGEKQFLLGNYEAAVEVLEDLVRRTRNPGMAQKSRFLLGETYEQMGDYEEAYRQYRKIIDQDRGASGRIVGRAKEKIAALREAGLF